MASLRDVARAAGVSVATASRVLRGSAGVRPETRARVEQAMRELLYVAPAAPEPAGAIGLFVPEFRNPVFAALAEAMETCAAEQRLATILCNTHGSARRELEYVRMLLERRVEGMIFISAEITDVRGKHSHYVQLLERGARLVFVNGGSDELEVTSVNVDERAAGRIATEHLLALGHERVGFVAGSPYAMPTREKALGRRDALRAAGLDDRLVAHAEFGVEGGRRALRELLARPPEERPTGVICSSDLMAIGALQEAAAAGLRVPEDLSVVGFDGIEAATWTQPPLTTVEQPIEELARTAVAALRAQVEHPGERQPSYVFRPRLRLGGSTAPPSSARSTS
ncbi:MAG TPA: LacI family DNA-binding transcriptional regulator [Gaiellaceae bacterium]|nr:LacI family DNA-binding transcriptional regulator [Gaiellaceae bacterium]